MGRVFTKPPIVAIDIGTTKICVLVGRQTGSQIEILGMGTSPSHGLRKGVVVDVAQTVQSIKAAVKEAELVAGCSIEAVTVGVSGSHIFSVNSHGAVPISKGGEVREVDIGAVLEVAKAVSLPEGQQVLHVLPKEYRIDGGEPVHNPLGLHGVRLEANVHIITGSISSVQNIVHSCELAGVQVKDIVLEQLASAKSVLTPDERELGVAILDIGGGTADLALYQNGSIRHTMVVPIAGNHFTHDIAVGLQTSLHGAEQIKQNYGLAKTDLLEQEQEIEIVTIQGEERAMIKRSFLAHIIESRATELFSIIEQEIEKQLLARFMTTGLVITGGGSLLPGIVDVAQAVLAVRARLGQPRQHTVGAAQLSSPIYATGVGLLLHGIHKEKEGIGQLQGPLVVKLFHRMKSWVSDFF